MRQVRNVHKGYDVQGELEENRQQDVEVEDVPQWTFTGEFLDRLSGNELVKGARRRA